MRGCGEKAERWWVFAGDGVSILKTGVKVSLHVAWFGLWNNMVNVMDMSQNNK